MRWLPTLNAWYRECQPNPPQNDEESAQTPNPQVSSGVNQCSHRGYYRKISRNMFGAAKPFMLILLQIRKGF